AFGSPADSVPALLRQPEGAREAADLILVDAESIALHSTRLPATGCTSSQAVAGQVVLTTGPGEIVVRAGRPGIAQVALRRFASAYMFVTLGRVAPEATVGLSLPRDRSVLPWHVRITTSAPAVVCGAS